MVVSAYVHDSPSNSSESVLARKLYPHFKRSKRALPRATRTRAGQKLPRGVRVLTCASNIRCGAIVHDAVLAFSGQVCWSPRSDRLHEHCPWGTAAIGFCSSHAVPTVGRCKVVVGSAAVLDEKAQARF